MVRRRLSRPAPSGSSDHLPIVAEVVDRDGGGLVEQHHLRSRASDGPARPACASAGEVRGNLRSTSLSSPCELLRTVSIISESESPCARAGEAHVVHDIMESNRAPLWRAWRSAAHGKSSRSSRDEISTPSKVTVPSSASPAVELPQGHALAAADLPRRHALAAWTSSSDRRGWCGSILLDQAADLVQTSGTVSPSSEE